MDLERTNQKVKERQVFSTFLQNDIFVDVFRHLHPNERSTFTCFDERTNARERNAGVRIDYVLVTKGLLSKVKTCEVVRGNSWIPHKWSDHFALLLDINSTSVRLLEKFGFTRWGHMPDVADIDGRECGHLIYGLRVREKWK